MKSIEIKTLRDKLSFFKWNSLLLIIVTTTFCQCKHPRPASSRLRGLWKLDKYESQDSVSGLWHAAANRIGYSGYILYDGIGHMAVQLLPPGFESKNNEIDLDSSSCEEIKPLLELQLKSYSYFANYKMPSSENEIEHDRISSNHSREIGVKVERLFEFRGDTLILTAREPIAGLKTRLRWVRQ